MKIRYVFFAMVVATQGFGLAPTYARSGEPSRREIRQTPILERPSRLGHFYGNTVRRMHARKASGPRGENSVQAPVVENGELAEPQK